MQKAFAEYTEAIRLSEESKLKRSEPYSERAAILVQLGELDKAIADYSKVISRSESDVDALIARANLYWRNNDLDRASQEFATILREIDEWDPYRWMSERHYLHVAWFLATFNDPQYRNGMQAVELALKGCDLAGWNSTDCFETLAAAHAENGEFELAAQWEARALEMMKGAKEKPGSAELKQTEDRLELYRSGKPYREQIKPRTAKRDAPP